MYTFPFQPDDLLSAKIQSLCPSINGNVCCTEQQFDTLRVQVQQASYYPFISFNNLHMCLCLHTLIISLLSFNGDHHLLIILEDTFFELNPYKYSYSYSYSYLSGCTHSSWMSCMLEELSKPFLWTFLLS